MGIALKGSFLQHFSHCVSGERLRVWRLFINKKKLRYNEKTFCDIRTSACQVNSLYTSLNGNLTASKCLMQLH